MAKTQADYIDGLVTMRTAFDNYSKNLTTRDDKADGSIMKAKD